MKTPESMQRLEELFHEAVELDTQKRIDLLARVKTSDPELAAEVESLIAVHDKPDSPIDSHLLEAAAELLADEPPTLTVDQVIGHYRVVSPLGKGGMGEVYLASDTNLERKVALKLLPAEFTNNKARLLRFIQEARAASSLNHPNIITIHEIGQADGMHFLATEFIDGQTLKQRMHTRMELRAVLEVSIQVAGALHAAHAAGIVHRDIKPENIMVRPDGYVKVLDFGLAKLTEKSSQLKSASSQIDTMMKFYTTPGTVLGTVNYMSPEQARGQALDERTDVFSLGIVMYEMTAGRKPFVAATSIDTLVALLEREPPSLEEFASEVPAEFQRIISKALRKDREERYQTIKDLLIDLKSLRDELVFTEKLERSKSPHTTAAGGKVVTKDQAELLTDITDQITLRKQYKTGRIVTLVAIMLTAVGIAGVVIWRRSGTTPAGISTALSTPATTAERMLSYWITVQKYRNGKPYQDPFRLRDDINFEKDYRIRLNLTSSQSGRLYLLNEGPAGADQTPTFNVLFPSETANNGSALITENQQIQIPQQSWFQFDQQQGTEKIWVVWAEKDVPELEAVKGFANSKDRGVISSPVLRSAINQFLKAHSSSTPSVEREQEKKETVVRANSEILVHVIKLEHH